MTNRTRTDSLLLAGFCAFLFLYGLGQFGLIGADEPRYAQVAREMLERHDWITPMLGGQPWLEKPPLYYWQAMLAYAIFGVSDWAARLPSALDATFLVLAVYFFLRRFRPGFALDGALITASSAGIVGYARAASMDMALAAAFTIAMLGWWTWRESGKKSDPPDGQVQPAPRRKAAMASIMAHNEEHCQQHSGGCSGRKHASTVDAMQPSHAGSSFSHR